MPSLWGLEAWVSVPFVRLVQEIFTLLKLVATGFSCHLHPQEFWLLQHPKPIHHILSPSPTTWASLLKNTPTHPATQPRAHSTPLLFHHQRKVSLGSPGSQGLGSPSQGGRRLHDRRRGRKRNADGLLAEGKENPHQHWLADCI